MTTSSKSAPTSKGRETPLRALVSSSSGAALVIVIWITAVLFAGAFFVLGLSKELSRSSVLLMDKLDAQLKAESALEVLKFYGLTGQFGTGSVVNAALTDLGVPQSIPIDGTSISLAEGITLAAVDAGSKLNVWNLNPEIVARILRIQGVGDQEATIVRDSITDWFDANDLKRLNGAESQYYRLELRAAYAPRNYPAPQSIHELHLIRGLDNPEVWEKIRGRLTLAPRLLPHINSMDAEMFRAVFDIPEDVAQQLILLRQRRGYLTYRDITAVTGIEEGILLNMITATSNRVIDATITAVSGGAREELRATIDFAARASTPWRVLELNR